MKRIKYICYYDETDAKIGRNYVLAATNKLKYIWDVLNRAGYCVDAISVSDCTETKFQYCKGGIYVYPNGNTLRLFPSFGGKKIIRVLGRYFLRVCFIFWFLLNIKKGEKIIVYHSLGYCKLLTILQRLTSCQYIGEIEEIYQNVTPQKKSVCKAEYDFVESCSSYIFPTHLLGKRLNSKGKPSVLIHGIYAVEQPRKVRWEDDNIHVIYAGTFDPNKGGAAAAAATAAYLPKDYHVHICGFGNESDTKAIIKTIEETNARSEATVTYDGLLKGEDFIVFLQKCHIGLSTQNPDAAFNTTSFPSKVLTYLANGLQVVSIRIPAVEQSGVGRCLSYYDEQTPRMIAEAIQSARESNMADPIVTLKRLDKQFENDMVNMLSK